MNFQNGKFEVITYQLGNEQCQLSTDKLTIGVEKYKFKVNNVMFQVMHITTLEVLEI